jgi:multiple sugar transport system permease protein
MFHSWDPVKGLASMEFVGLENLSFAFEDPLVWTSLGNTLWLAVVSGVPQHLVAIPLAYLINEKLGRWRNAVMGAYFLPYITSTVAIAMMFSTLFSTDYGMVNAMLTSLAKSQVFEHLLPSTNVDWLGDPRTIKPIVAFVVFWRYLGFNVILYVAAMQAISRDQYEAARMDGAKSLQQFWYITLPQLKPIMFFGVTLTIIGGLQLFEEPFILTGGKGGMEYAGMTTAMYMFRTAFDYNDYGLASAISWMLFIIILAMTVLTNRAFKNKEGQS